MVGWVDLVYVVVVWIFLCDVVFGMMVVVEVGDFEVFDFVLWQIWYVDVEDGVGRQWIGFELGDDFYRGLCGSVEVFWIVVVGNQ